VQYICDCPISPSYPYTSQSGPACSQPATAYALLGQPAELPNCLAESALIVEAACECVVSPRCCIVTNPIAKFSFNSAFSCSYLQAGLRCTRFVRYSDAASTT
jgi:hypothetical protein